MGLPISALVTVVGGWSVVVIGVSTWVSHLATERIVSTWRSKESSNLEEFKSTLATERANLENATRSFQFGQDANQGKRLEAAESIWKATLDLRNDFSGVVFFFSILLPSEYSRILSNRQSDLTKLLAPLDLASIHEKMRKSENSETLRIYLGEALWLRFFTYRALLGRLAFLVVDGRKQERFEKDWRDDGGVRQILSRVFEIPIVERLLKSDINTLVNSVEALILEEISMICSGKKSSLESFENSKELRERFLSVSPK